MRNDKIINQLRAFHYLSGALKNQQDDPFCGKCLSFERVLNAAMDNFLECESNCRSNKEHLSKELSELLRGVYHQLASIRHPADPTGQKKAGNCKLPEGVCFTQAAVSFYEAIRN